MSARVILRTYTPTNHKGNQYLDLQSTKPKKPPNHPVNP